LPVDNVEQWFSDEEATQVFGEEPTVRLPVRGVAATRDMRGQ